MARGQMVRHWFLVPGILGSSPSAPAIKQDDPTMGSFYFTDRLVRDTNRQRFGRQRVTHRSHVLRSLGEGRITSSMMSVHAIVLAFQQYIHV